MYCRVPILVSLYRFLLFFPFPCPVYSTVPTCFIFLYLPSHFSIFQPQVRPSLSLSHFYTGIYLLLSSLKISHSPFVYIYIYYTFFIQSSSYLPVSHKFNPTSLRLAPYTFHCSIKRPTRIYTRVYTMNSVVVVVVVQKAAEKANRIRVGHDTS